MGSQRDISNGTYENSVPSVVYEKCRLALEAFDEAAEGRGGLLGGHLDRGGVSFLR